MPVLSPFAAYLIDRAPRLYIPGVEPPPVWRDSTMLRKMPPALWLHRQEFGPGLVREGVVGLIDRNTPSPILPHEKTEPARVAACRAERELTAWERSSLLAWCNDDDGALAALLSCAESPSIDVADSSGCRHLCWPVTTPEWIAALQDALTANILFLTDGHHRYAAGWQLATVQIRTAALINRAGQSIEELERRALTGELLPPKSTDFHPKLAAPLLLHRVHNDSVMPPTAQIPGVRKPSSKYC